MSESPSKAIIVLQKISKDFYLGKNVVSALHEISLDILPGEYVILYGPSGCGKSTLLNVVAGLEIPTTGKVVIRGDDLSHLSANDLARHRREKIGIVFQQFNLLRTMNIVNNVALPELFRGEKRRRRLSRAKNLLQEFGLGQFYRHKPTELSGGQQQRVAIARALVNNPWIILADEPTGNVDSKTADEIMNIFHDLNRKSKRTILLVTHNPDYLHYADRVIYMRDGRLIKEDRQMRSQQEIEILRREREAAHLVREYHRDELDTQAKALGISPSKYPTEELLAQAILLKRGISPAKAKLKKSPHDILIQAKKLSAQKSRKDLDRMAQDLGLDPNQYKTEQTLARAIIETQQSHEHS